MSHHNKLTSVDLSELPPTLTLAQAADVLHCCKRTVARRIATGQLPTRTNGGKRIIILRRDIEALIAGGR